MIRRLALALFVLLLALPATAAPLCAEPRPVAAMPAMGMASATPMAMPGMPDHRPEAPMPDVHHGLCIGCIAPDASAEPRLAPLIRFAAIRPIPLPQGGDPNPGNAPATPPPRPIG